MGDNMEELGLSEEDKDSIVRQMLESEEGQKQLGRVISSFVDMGMISRMEIVDFIFREEKEGK